MTTDRYSLRLFTPIVEDGDVIVVWFSCGAASAVAAKKTIEKYSDKCTIRILNNPVIEEDSDNRRFLHDVQLWLGVTIESVMNPEYPNCSAFEIWEKGLMSTIHGAPCTLGLKKEARQEWERHNRADWHVLGFTSEEKERADNFILTERENLLPVLIQNNLTKKDCFDIVRAAGLRLPKAYYDGYANANCIGCVKATSPTYWNHVRKKHPDVFLSRAEQSKRIGARLCRYKDERIFLSDLPPDAKGRPMKSIKIECGVFCEEAV